MQYYLFQKLCPVFSNRSRSNFPSLKTYPVQQALSSGGRISEVILPKVERLRSTGPTCICVQKE